MKFINAVFKENKYNWNINSYLNYTLYDKNKY